MLAFLILFFGITSRLVFHEPNFTPVIALALFGGSFLRKKQALFLPLVLMVISDLIIGLHATVPFTWGSILLIAFVGTRIREKRSLKMFVTSGVSSALLFFAVTNFGSWLTMYPLTVDGLKTCYIAAIPFFRMSLMSTIIYSVFFYGLYEMTAHVIRRTKFAAVML